MTTHVQSPKAAEVTVDSLSKSFRNQCVLDDINLDVKSGETFIIMGPSGSGKSVLLKTIIGLLSPDSGKVLIDGLDASNPRTFKRIVTSIVFQAGALFNSLTVFDNLAFYPKEHRLYSKSEIKDRVNETLQMLSLENAAYKYPSELSGGMKKRVAIARSLMLSPQLLLYDEPTSELDPIMSATISEIIATLKEKVNVTSIVVTHDRELARNISDRVALIIDGRIRIVAKPDELSKVDDPVVQEFLNPKIDIANPRFRKLKN